MNKKMMWVILFFLLLSLACRLPFLDSNGDSFDEDSGGNTADQGELPDMDSESFRVDVKDPARLEPVGLSAPQAQILSARGAPNRFMIQFSEGMRQETWYFDLSGYEVTFRDGEIYVEKEAAVNPEETIFFSVYFPWQFNQQMGLSELLAISQTDSFAVESLEEVFQEDFSIVYLKGMDVGFREGRVLYIRSLPLGEGAIEASTRDQTDPSIQQTQVEPIPTPAEVQSEASGVTLTAIEQANQGEHQYLYECSYSDGEDEKYSAVSTWEFTEEGVFIDGEGPFPKISNNYYGIDDEYGDLFIQFSDWGVSLTGTTIIADSEGDPFTEHYYCRLTLE